MADAMERLNAALEGRYEIEREIGEGGMATVYLAKDLKHNRNVALKVLKPELAAVVGGERFLAEIETTANLQHPHILPLFDSGQAESFLFFVMPYMEGETLRDRIDRERQLPVDEALGIATSIAHALQHAHDRGVVHRDIKPGNILLQDGQPVVADFGIALAIGSAGGARLTETGLSVGTPYYMSPEQATGDQVVGPASDTFALACVLYEMLVGEPPYPGNTAQAVLGKIIQGAPVSATAVRRSIPANVDAAIRKALERLPADRFTGASQFAKALADSTFTHGEAPGAGSGAASSARVWRLASAALGVTTLVLAGTLVSWSLQPEPAPRMAQFESVFRDGQGPISWGTASFNLSPEGSYVVYRGPLMSEGGAGTQLWIRRWDDLEASPVRGTEGAGQPAVSPDGSQIAFQRGGAIQVANIDGGPVRTLDQGQWPRWSHDGATIYFVDGAGRPQRVASTGGIAEDVPMTSDGDHPAFAWISQVLPDGVHAIGQAQPAGQETQVVALVLETGELRRLTEGGWPLYTTSGHLTFLASDGSLIAAPFDPRSAEIVGPSVPMLEGIVQYAVSRTGDLVYVTSISAQGELEDTELVWVTRTGQVSPVQSGFRFDRGGGNFVWRLSPDDTRLALRRRVGGNSDIWIKELPDGALRRLTFDEEEQRVPWWSPDGSTVLYLSGPFGARHVWSRNADGTGTATPIFEEGSYAEGLWSPDGEWIILRNAGLTGGSEADRDILAYRPGVDERPAPLIATEYMEQHPTLSPDGRWIAYESNETGRREVFVRPFPEIDGGKWQVSNEGGVAPLWSHGGDEIYFVRGSDMVAATVSTESGFRVLSTSELFELPGGALIGSGTGAYDVTSDDERFVMALDLTAQTSSGATPDLVLVQNFVEELKARVAR